MTALKKQPPPPIEVGDRVSVFTSRVGTGSFQVGQGVVEKINGDRYLINGQWVHRSKFSYLPTQRAIRDRKEAFTERKRREGVSAEGRQAWDRRLD